MITKDKTFIGQTIALSGGYERCVFQRCRLEAPDGDEVVTMTGCSIHNCELVGEGWPQEALDGKTGRYTDAGFVVEAADESGK